MLVPVDPLIRPVRAAHPIMATPCASSCWAGPPPLGFDACLSQRSIVPAFYLRSRAGRVAAHRRSNRPRQGLALAFLLRVAAVVPGACPLLTHCCCQSSINLLTLLDWPLPPSIHLTERAHGHFPTMSFSIS